MAKGPVVHPIWSAGLVCIVLAMLLYAPALPVGFLGDDFVVAYRAGVLGDLHQGGFFRPLPDLTILLGHGVHGASASAHRLVNIVVHACCGILLFLLLRQLSPSTPGAAWMAALLFVAYPYHGEAVIWITGRGVAMATAFTLLGLLALRPTNPTPHAALLSGLWWSLGLLCYESALIFPGLALVVLLLQRASGRRTAALVVCWACAFLLHGALRTMATGAWVNSYGSGLLEHGAGTYLLNIPKAFGRLFLPPEADAQAQLVKFGVLCMVLLAAAVPAIRAARHDARKRRSIIGLLGMLLLSMALPVLGGVSTQTSESDRFLYMPSAFLAALLALWLATVARRAIPVPMTMLLMVEVVLLHHTRTNWLEASHIADRVLEDLPGKSGTGMTYVVHLPDEHEGAFIFRHGFREALLLRGLDAERIKGAGLLLRKDLLRATDPIRSTRQGDRILLHPGVEVAPTNTGANRLTTATDTAYLSPTDRVLYWDRHDLRALWPQE